MQNKKKKTVWDSPWQYAESFIIVFAFVLIGFALEWFSKQSISSLEFPTNLYFIGTFIALNVGLYFILKKQHSLFLWLKSPYLAIASITAILFLVILMGSFTQDVDSSSNLINNLALNRIAFSFPFIFVLIFFLSNLIFVILFRLNSFSIRNLLFALNHIGIFIVSIALMFSVGDIQKHTVKIDKDNYLYSVGQTELPFALRLKDFELDFFAPKMAIVDNKTDEIINTNQILISVDTDTILEFQDYKISVEQYLPKSIKQGEKYYYVNQMGYAPSAKVQIFRNGKLFKEDWISCGSFVYPSDFAELDSNYTLVMLEPEAKKYQSIVWVYYPNQTKKEILLEVNKPVTIGKWDIYQTDYNKEMGTWSDYSTIEMVYDPWLPVIYIGIGLLILGAFMLMFVGKLEKL